MAICSYCNGLGERYPEEGPCVFCGGSGEIPEFRVIIAGGRDFDDYDLLALKLDHLLSAKLADSVVIVSGMARGADALGVRYAREFGLTLHEYPAEWDKYGRSAGYRRNEIMAKNAEALVAFWDGKSKGTAHMIKTARERGLAVRVISY